MLPQSLLNGEATCNDIMQCIYNLSNYDIDIYRRLLKKSPQRTEDLAKRTKRDRSTVHRSLTRLGACGMVRKETRHIERGGYYHIYSAVEKREIRERMRECAEEIHERMLGGIARIDEL